MITFNDFQKIEIKIGTILSAEKVDGSEKLLKLSVGFGESTLINFLLSKNSKSYH